MKRIAILMATYNGQKYIEEQLESIRLGLSKLNAKQYTVDIIISDDNSMDSTAEKIYRYREKNNLSNISILDVSRKGSAVRNFSFLLKNVSEEYDFYFFSDQDDFWLPSKLEAFLDLLIVTDSDCKPILWHSDLSIVDDNLFPISNSMFNYQKLNKDSSLYNLIVQNSVTGCVMAINKVLLKRSKYSQIEKSIMHDWYISLIASALGNIYFIDKATILYRQHGKNEVGAKKIDLSYIIDSVINFRESYKRIVNSLYRSRVQAKLFLEDFNESLTIEQRNDLTYYINSIDFSIFRRIGLFKKGFRKNGLFRNLFYLFFIILGK